jgi:hypothetical protein
MKKREKKHGSVFAKNNKRQEQNLKQCSGFKSTGVKHPLKTFS